MKKNWLLMVLILMIAFLSSCGPKSEPALESVKVMRGDILANIPSTGSVMPRNRVEIKPPVSGRVEDVLGKEGERVKKGQIIAWISSNERATLLDAARSKGKAELKYWENVYKPAPIVAPLDGFIILRNVEPGQSITTVDPVLVMADKLIVKAQVDETDLGYIKLRQKATIVLDAYPEKSIPAYVEHIEYESQVINNVTIYQVYVIPYKVPSFFRSGMSATINFLQEAKKNILILPTRTVKKNESNSYVFIKQENNPRLVPIQIKTGLENSDSIEVIAGVSEGQEVFIPTAKIIQNIFSKQNRRGPGGGPINIFGRKK